MAITVVPQEDWSRALPDIGKAIAEALIQRRQATRDQWFQAVQLRAQSGADLDERTFEQMFPYLKGRYAEYQNAVSGLKRKETMDLLDRARAYGKDTGKPLTREIALAMGATPETVDEVIAASEAGAEPTAKQIQALDMQMDLAKREFNLKVDEATWGRIRDSAQMNYQQSVLRLQEKGINLQEASLELQRSAQRLAVHRALWEEKMAGAQIALNASQLVQAEKDAVWKMGLQWAETRAKLAKEGVNIEKDPQLRTMGNYFAREVVLLAGVPPQLLGFKDKEIAQMFGPDSVPYFQQIADDMLKASGVSTEQLQGAAEKGEWEGLLPLISKGVRAWPGFVESVGETGARAITKGLFGTAEAERRFPRPAPTAGATPTAGEVLQGAVSMAGQKPTMPTGTPTFNEGQMKAFNDLYQMLTTKPEEFYPAGGAAPTGSSLDLSTQSNVFLLPDADEIKKRINEFKLMFPNLQGLPYDLTRK